MFSENSKLLQVSLAPLMKSQGFLKTGPTWRKSFSDSIGVLNIQGSQWSPTFHINLGIFFRQLGENRKPCDFHCHVRSRLADFFPDQKRLDELLDFGRPVGPKERLHELDLAILHYAIPWLDSVSTPAGAVEYGSRLPRRSPWVTPAARAFLGLPQA